MRRYHIQEQKKKRRRLLVIFPVIAMIATAVVLASGAVFTSTSANPNNVFTAGNLHHVNSEADSAILTAEKMKPGDSVNGQVTITNDGDLPGVFTLSTTNLESAVGPKGGVLADVLQLRVMDGTTEVYSGSIKAVGTIALGTWPAGASHTYDFTVTFPDGGEPGTDDSGDNIYKNAGMSIQFDWNEAQTAS